MTLRFDSPDELRGAVSPDVLKANPELGIEGGVQTRRPTECGIVGSKGIVQKMHNITPTKHHAVRTGHYQSKKEAKFAAELELRKQAGEIDFFLDQVRFWLPGVYTDKRGRTRRASHRLDNITFKHVVGDLWKIEWLEVKGQDLPMGKLKRMQCQDIYHIHIQVV